MGEVSVRIKPIMEIKGDYARICFRIGRRSFEEYMGENQESTGMHHEDLAKQKYNTAKHRNIHRGMENFQQIYGIQNLNMYVCKFAKIYGKLALHEIKK